jgi:hypothetical protein
MLNRNLTLIFLVALAALVSACVSPTPPSVARLGDGNFIVSHPLVYRIQQTNQAIEVPKGFITDLASIPRPLWWWESPIDRSMASAIIHDFLYWDQTCSKDEADAVLSLAMQESGVSATTRKMVYLGVRTSIGDKAFADNKAAKAKGENRFLTPAYTDILLGRPVEPEDDLKSILARAKREDGLAAAGQAPPRLKSACIAALSLFKNEGR